MKNYFNKYRKQYSYIFLPAYLFLISLTIFHYHHYDFRQGNYNLEQIPVNQTPNPFDKFSDINGECIVAHFSNSIDNISYVPVISSEIADYNIYLPIKKNNRIPKQEIHFKHHLRAPPSELS